MKQHIALEFLVAQARKRHVLDGWISDGNERFGFVHIREVAGPCGDLGEDGRNSELDGG